MKERDAYRTYIMKEIKWHSRKLAHSVTILAVLSLFFYDYFEGN